MESRAVVSHRDVAGIDPSQSGSSPAQTKQGDGCEMGVDDRMSERAMRSATGIKAYNAAPGIWVL
jgi:hypothetical protein